MTRKHQYCTYIVASTSGTLYVGVTNDIFRRTLEHKRGEIIGFSKQYKCNRLVYYEGFQYVRSAIAREKELKGRSRKKKVVLIENTNPRSLDFAESWGGRLVLANESLEKYR